MLRSVTPITTPNTRDPADGQFLDFEPMPDTVMNMKIGYRPR